MLEAYADKLDEKGREYVMQIKKDSERLTRLLYDVLKLSVLTRSEMKEEGIDLSALVKEITGKLMEAEPGRVVDFIIQPGVYASGDPGLVRVLLENLLDNAWKFTGRQERARIEFGGCGVPPIEAFEGRLHAECGVEDRKHKLNSEIRNPQSEIVYFVKDNGAGFDMAYAERIFTPFQRLHNIAKFPGIGIGLASVQRIVHRHGGRVWVEAEEGKGAAFFFTLRGHRSP
jgi:light-regulated signal transduction histidine kinase (bacteriophytochrome)